MPLGREERERAIIAAAALPADLPAAVAERRPRCCDCPMTPQLNLDLVVCLLCGRERSMRRWYDPGLILAEGG
jgi:hypothetical protein